MAFAIYGMAVVLAPSIGPTLGGWITDNYSWRWIFYINVPIGIISLLLTNHFVQDPPYLKEEMAKQRRSHRPLRIDYIGIGLIALGIGCLQVVLDKGQEDDWFASHFIATLSAISLTSIVALVIWELRHKSPASRRPSVHTPETEACYQSRKARSSGEGNPGQSIIRRRGIGGTRSKDDALEREK